MSKKVVFHFLLFLFAFQFFAKAQTTWPMPGAKWRYCLIGWMYSSYDKSGHYLEFSYTNDTLINGTTYQVIKNTLNFWPSGNNPVNTSMVHLTRFSNDTVYKRVHDKDYIFLVFNAQLGDVFTSYRVKDENTFNDSACTAKMPLRVTGISLSTVSGIELKTFQVKDTLLNDIIGMDWSGSNYHYTERIGVWGSLFFTEPCFFSNNDYCSMFSDCWGYSLTKYEDATFVYGSDNNCKPSSISESKINEISIYPNPAENVLFLQIDKITNPLTLSICNNLGELVFTKNNLFGSQKIDVSHLQNGIYFASLFNEKTNDIAFKTKLIVNKSN
jgi:hypothetical protein